jgi:hypothetical protein
MEVNMDDIQTILALISTFLGIVLVFLKIFEAWIKVAVPVKQFLTNRYVWLIIAALIFVGICLFLCRDKEVSVAIKTTHEHYATAMDWRANWVIKADTETIYD